MIIKASTISNCIEIASKLASKYNGLTAKKCFVFCEDKITLALELEIAKACGGGFFNIEVSTFTRYISSRNNGVKALSKSSSVMAIRRIILNEQKNLKCFKNLKYCPNLSVTIYELISQLASAKVTVSDLAEFKNNNENKLSKALINKLEDISLIYDKYREYLNKNGYKDGSDYLELMPSIIDSDAELKNAVVILAGFSSVTKQRGEIFKKLYDTASEVYSVVLAGENNEVYTNETYIKLKEIDKNGIDSYKINQILEVETLQKYLFNPEVFDDDFEKLATDKITVTEYQDVKTEVESVCKDIVKQVKQKNKRYKNIAVAVGSIDGYELIISKIFKEYGVPYYIDKTENLFNHPISQFILTCIDASRKGLAINEVIKLVNNGVFNTNKTITDGFIKYVKKYAITRKLLKQEFTYADDNLPLYEKIRKNINDIYNEFHKAKTVDEVITAIKYAIDVVDVNNNIKRYSNKLEIYGEKKICDFNEKVLEKTFNLLEEIGNVLNDCKISLLDFKTVFISGASSTSVGAIPLYNDAVYVGECKDVKIKKVDVLYAVGINSNVPFSKSDLALLSDNDIDTLFELSVSNGDSESLEKFRIKVEPKIEIVNKREKESVSLALTSFNEKLKVSYANVGADGKSALKSELIDYLTKIFAIEIVSHRKKVNDINDSIDKSIGNFSQEERESIADKYLSCTSAMREIASIKNRANKRGVGVEIESFKQAVTEIGGTLNETANKVLSLKTVKPEYVTEAKSCLKKEEISASILEEYFGCPYSNFVKYTLRLKEEATGEMQVNVIGDFLHKLVELYVKQINTVTSKETSDALVDKIVKEIYKNEKYSIYLSQPSFVLTYDKLIEEGKKACYDAYLTIANSKFKPFEQELNFGEKYEYKGIKLNAKDGNYTVTGKIDRVDVCEPENSKTDENSQEKPPKKVRIIDYKSGGVHPDVESFYTGNNLQLYLYMNVFNKSEYEPAGAYYFQIKDDYVAEDKKRKQILDGYTVNTSEIINASDVNLKPSEASNLVKVHLTSKGVPHGSWSKVLTKDEMNDYRDYAVMIASKGVDEINSGYVKATPYNPEQTCKYCKFAGLCGTHLQDAEGRKVTDVKPITVSNAVRIERGEPIIEKKQKSK